MPTNKPNAPRNLAEVLIWLTSGSMPVFTPTLPPPDQASAQRRISELIQQEYSVVIPLPSVYRFDDPVRPYLLRWIGAAYFEGMFYHLDLSDDPHHYELTSLPYAPVEHPSATTDYRPASRPAIKGCW